MKLYRPVGLKELELIFGSGMKTFPPRLPEQPIFYPVLNQPYAEQIARDWNAKGTEAGFVLEFEVDQEYLARFERRVVGGKEHEELWVPAEELEEFNGHICGLIRVVNAFKGGKCDIDLDFDTLLPKAWTDPLEKLAALEHEQWSSWTRHLLENQSEENLARWRRQVETPYLELTEDEKESDRIWAKKALNILEASPKNDSDVLYEGRFLRVKKNKTWEYVERRKTSGIVAILAVTSQNRLLLVEQFRPPLGKRVIEIPAGLAGDIDGSEHEELAEAARRELLEETGYEAATMRYLTEGPASAGLSTEIITFFEAHDLKRVTAGGGDGGENIQVHEVQLSDLESWLETKRKEGCLVDYKIYTALYFHR